MNNNTLLTLCLVLITMLSVKLHCTNEELNKELAIVNALENENATIATDRMLVLDSVEVLQDKLKESEKEKLNAKLLYLKQTRAVKNKMLKRYGNVQIDTFNNAYLDSNAVDSINALSIHYHFCVEDNKTKDTIISHLTNANLKADTLLANKDTIIKAQTKVAKKANNLVKVWQGVSYGLAALTLIVYITAK
jgi:hypothetical protein